MAGLGQFLLEIGVDANALQRGLNNAESKIESFGKKAESLGTKLSIAISAPLALISKQALSAAGDFESLQVSFGTMLKDMEKGKALMQEIQKFNLSTPFQFEEVAGASKSLLAFGFAQQQIIPNLRMIGDLSSALGINIKDLADIYGKAKVQGRLFAEDINQLTGRGIPIIAEFAKQFGVADNEIKKMVEDGKISFTNLEQAFISMTSKGGQFFGMTAAQSTTWNGVMSNAMDSINQSLKELGDSMIKNLDLKTIVPQATQYISDLTKKFSELTPESQKAILAIGGIAIVLPPLLALAGTILPAISTGFLALISTAGLAGVAIAGAAIYAVSHWEKVEGILYKVKKGLQDTILGAGLAGAALQGVFNPAGASEQRAKLLSAYSKNVGIDPSIVNQIKSDYQSNKKFMYKKGEKPNTVNNPPPPPSTGLGGDKKSLDALKKSLEETQSLQKEFANKRLELTIASMEDETNRSQQEAKKRAYDEISEYSNQIIGKKGLEDDFFKWRAEREKSLQNELAKIQREAFKTPNLIKTTGITDVMKSMDFQTKGVGEKMQKSLSDSLSNSMRGITQQGDKNTLASILGIAPEAINSINFDEYVAKAQMVVGANQQIKDSISNLATSAASNMSIIIGEMIAGTATMADLGRALTSTISNALADIAKVQIATGLATGNALQVFGGIAAGIGAGIFGGISKKSQNKSSSYQQQPYNSVVRGGDIFIAQNRYQTIKGF